MASQLVSLQEICALLNRSPDEMISLVENDKCPAIIFNEGQTYSFPKEEVLERVKPKPIRKIKKSSASRKRTTAKKSKS